MCYKQLLSLLLILPPLLFSSCDGDGITLKPDKEDVLPPITMEGKNTFGCLLNGEVWVHTPYPFASNLSGSYSRNFKSLHISAAIKYNGILESYIALESNFDSLGVHDLSQVLFFDLKYTELFPMRKEFLIEEEPHFIEITHLDLEENIVSGLFQFTMLDTLFGDTLRFTEGRFDYKWAN